jgi:hypothetical protein
MVESLLAETTPGFDKCIAIYLLDILGDKHLWTCKISPPNPPKRRTHTLLHISLSGPSDSKSSSQSLAFDAHRQRFLFCVISQIQGIKNKSEIMFKCSRFESPTK